MTKQEIAAAAENIVFGHVTGIDYTKDTLQAIELITEYSFNMGRSHQYNFSFVKREEDKWNVYLISVWNSERDFNFESDSLPLAICMVILRSKGYTLHETE